MDFYELCRRNTGKNFLDSGDYYGRHYEKPPVPADRLLVYKWEKDCPALISTAVYLDRIYDIDESLKEEWEIWDSWGKELDIDKSIDTFLGIRGYTKTIKDNTYNSGDGDLDQDFIFTWYVYGSEAAYVDCPDLAVIYIHTGCDIRSGYAGPVFCTPSGDRDTLSDIQAQYRAVEGRVPRRVKFRGTTVPLLEYGGLPDLPFEEGKIDLSSDYLIGIDEDWQSGMSACPYEKLEKDVERWFEFTRTDTTVCVLLKTGEIVKVQAEHSLDYQ